jgi:methyl-accepting chemotaxis protein WspA
MQETMVQVMGAASGISGKLTVLNEKAGSISQVVTTIAKVADQTNLLSLNAAIEAEKAGEYGRGFSVVATEIRRLADQTAVASHDIEQTVKEMQAAVSAGVMSVDKFSEEVRRGVQEVNQVGAQLNEIIGHVQALTPRFETVNEGMQMHAVGASQISSALVQLGESTQQTVHSLKQSNQTIERLNEATRMLRNAVSQFKLQTAVGVPERPRGIASLELRRNSDRPVDEGRKVDS